MRAIRRFKRARHAANLCRRFKIGMNKRGESVGGLNTYEILVGYRDLVIGEARKQNRALNDDELEEAAIKALEMTVYALEHDTEPPAVLI